MNEVGVWLCQTSTVTTSRYNPISCTFSSSITAVRSMTTEHAVERSACSTWVMRIVPWEIFVVSKFVPRAQHYSPAPSSVWPGVLIHWWHLSLNLALTVSSLRTRRAYSHYWQKPQPASILSSTLSHRRHFADNSARARWMSKGRVDGNNRNQCQWIEWDEHFRRQWPWPSFIYTTPDNQRCSRAISSLFRNTDGHRHVEFVVLVIVHVVRELKPVHSMLVMADFRDIERCSSARWASWWGYWADRKDRPLNRSVGDTWSAYCRDRMNVRNCNHCCSHYQVERSVQWISHLGESALRREWTSIICSYLFESRLSRSSTNVTGTERERSAMTGEGEWLLSLPNDTSNKDRSDQMSIVEENLGCAVWANRRRPARALHGSYWRK